MMLCFSNFNRGLQYRQRRISHIILRHINNIYKPTYLISYQIGSKSGGTQFPLFCNVAICTCFHLRLRILFHHTVVVFVYMGILSMGMTGDYEVAIEEGATMVRVGTGIFGARNYNV